jgi:hypothetical protein
MRQLLICITFAFLLIGCTRKDVRNYKSSFQKNKRDYLFITDSISVLFKQKDSLFKFDVEFTGKRFVEYPYINDTTIFSFYNLHLNEKNRGKMSKIMYDLGLGYVSVYRDSCKFIFSGRYKDTIVIYNYPFSSTRGTLIAQNTFLIFAE